MTRKEIIVPTHSKHPIYCLYTIMVPRKKKFHYQKMWFTVNRLKKN